MRREKHQNCQGGCHGKCCLKVEHLNVQLGEDRILDDVGFYCQPRGQSRFCLDEHDGAGKSVL